VLAHGLLSCVTSGRREETMARGSDTDLLYTIARRIAYHEATEIPQSAAVASEPVNIPTGGRCIYGKHYQEELDETRKRQWLDQQRKSEEVRECDVCIQLRGIRGIRMCCANCGTTENVQHYNTESALRERDFCSRHCILQFAYYERGGGLLLGQGVPFSTLNDLTCNLCHLRFIGRIGDSVTCQCPTFKLKPLRYSVSNISYTGLQIIFKNFIDTMFIKTCVKKMSCVFF